MVPTKFSAQKMTIDPHKDISRMKFWWKGWKRRELEHFPGGTMDKNPPANAGDTGLSPGLGRFHMPRATKPRHHNSWACVSQLHSPLALLHTPATAPASLEPVLQIKRSRLPLGATRESPWTAMKIQRNSSKTNKRIEFHRIKLQTERQTEMTHQYSESTTCSQHSYSTSSSQETRRCRQRVALKESGG